NPDLDNIKIQVLKRAQFLSDEKHKSNLEAAILPLLNPSLYPQSTPGAKPETARADDYRIRVQAVEAIKAANIVSESSIFTLKSLAAPKPENGTLPLEPNAQVRLAALSALRELDSQVFQDAAETSCKRETDLAVRSIAEQAKLSRTIPVRNEEYRRRVTTGATYLDNTEKYGWKQGKVHLEALTAEFGKIPKTITVKEVRYTQSEPIDIAYPMTVSPPSQPVTIKYEVDVVKNNPDRMKYLEDGIFKDVRSKPSPERERAEQIIFYLVSEMAEGRDPALVADPAEKAIIRQKVHQALFDLLDKDPNQATLHRTWMLILDADTDQSLRLELLKRLGKTQGGKPEHAILLAEALFADLKDPLVETKQSEIRLQVRKEFLSQMKTARCGETLEVLDIIANTVEAVGGNEFKIKAVELLCQLRDSVSVRFTEATPTTIGAESSQQSANRTESMLADRILRAVQSGRSCQEVVDIMFSSCKGRPIRDRDPRANAIRLALEAKGVDIEYSAQAFGLTSQVTGPRPTLKENGAEMIRLAAAFLVLQDGNNAFSTSDRMKAFSVCARLAWDGRENGYRRDA
ncbi:MAG: hypothetical protein K2Z81_06555, partial [Cyanobacteria bacterium]|nr:hypothetical protein [Cyanobacteriota bacterium]